ncbi:MULTISPECIES: hypothetical protein [Pseudonocardiaceae]|nr:MULTISPECIES: hypothetical protein [Pseudonocardiaceae]
MLEQALREPVSATVFGERYDDTAWLELPQLAVCQPAEVTSLLWAHPYPR